MQNVSTKAELHRPAGRTSLSWAPCSDHRRNLRMRFTCDRRHLEGQRRELLKKLSGLLESGSFAASRSPHQKNPSPIAGRACSGWTRVNMASTTHSARGKTVGTRRRFLKAFCRALPVPPFAFQKPPVAGFLPMQREACLGECGIRGCKRLG